MPSGSVSGEIIAGVEPIARTLEAIDLIARLGAFPTVCIFRPTIASDMESWPPPTYEEMRAVMAHVFDACRRHWIPIGLAPGVETSLVVTPDETALLAQRGAGFYLYETYLRLASLVTRPLFARRLRTPAVH
jgi:sugar phosphate isomerase/epimerase